MARSRRELIPLLRRPSSAGQRKDVVVGKFQLPGRRRRKLLQVLRRETGYRPQIQGEKKLYITM
jgi:ribosomal protein S6E (S10)